MIRRRFLILVSFFAISLEAQKNCSDLLPSKNTSFFLLRRSNDENPLMYFISSTYPLQNNASANLQLSCSHNQKSIYLLNNKESNRTQFHILSVMALSNPVNGTNWGVQPIFEPCQNKIPFVIQTHRGFTETAASQYRIYSENNLIAYVKMSEDNINSFILRSAFNNSVLEKAFRNPAWPGWEITHHSTLSPLITTFLVGFKETKDYSCAQIPTPSNPTWKIGLLAGGFAASVAVIIALIQWQHHLNKPLRTESFDHLLPR